jgi:hypothetical protein
MNKLVHEIAIVARLGQCGVKYPMCRQWLTMAIAMMMATSDGKLMRYCTKAASVILLSIIAKMTSQDQLGEPACNLIGSIH